MSEFHFLSDGESLIPCLVLVSPLPSFHFQINQPRALDQLIGNLNLDLPHKLG